MMLAVCPVAPHWVPSAAGEAGPHTHPSAAAAFVLGAPWAQQSRPGLEDLRWDVLPQRRCPPPAPGSWSRMVSVDPSLLFGSREPRGVGHRHSRPQWSAKASNDLHAGLFFLSARKMLRVIANGPYTGLPAAGQANNDGKVPVRKQGPWQRVPTPGACQCNCHAQE